MISPGRVQLNKLLNVKKVTPTGPRWQATSSHTHTEREGVPEQHTIESTVKSDVKGRERREG